MTTETELLPCPHCNHPAMWVNGVQSGVAIVCGGAPSCRSSVGLYGGGCFATQAAAIAAWNRRSAALSPASPAEPALEGGDSSEEARSLTADDVAGLIEADMRRRADEIDHAGNKDSSPWSGDLRRWAAALSRLQAERNAAIRSAAAVCDSYAAENQRLFDRAEAADGRLAEVTAERDRLNEARFLPLGDNHHNALKCPYCNPEQIDPVAERASAATMREALSEVRDWIRAWSPVFTEDDEWEATEAKMNAALGGQHG